MTQDLRVISAIRRRDAAQDAIDTAQDASSAGAALDAAWGTIHAGFASTLVARVACAQVDMDAALAEADRTWDVALSHRPREAMVYYRDARDAWILAVAARCRYRNAVEALAHWQSAGAEPLLERGRDDVPAM
jgi:hypothetical protein